MDLVEYCYYWEISSIDDCHNDKCPVLELCIMDAYSNLLTHYAEGEN